MKKKFTFLTAVVMLLAFLAVPLGMFGQTATFTPSHFSGQGTEGTGSAISATVSGVTFACNKGYGTTQIRCYKNSTITISSEYTITGINFTYTSTGYDGNLSSSYTNLSTNSWSSGSLGEQARITQCVVTYTSGSTTYTINISPTTIDAEYTGSYNSGYQTGALTMTTNISGTNPNVFSVVYSETENGDYSTIIPAMMGEQGACVVYQTNTFKVGWNVEENETQSTRDCYFKVKYGTNTYSNAVHVTQSAAPAPTYTVTLNGGNTISADYAGNVTSSTITVSTNLTGTVLYDVVYIDNSVTYPSNQNPYDWFEAEVNNSNEIECTILPNSTSAERPAQFKVFAANNDDEAYSEVITLTQAAVAAPTFDPNGATFHGTQNVTLASATSGASIRYTLDGTIPTATTGIEYENGTPIQLTSTKTVKAIAYVNVNEVNITSSVSEATFTQEQTAAPTFDPSAGAVEAGTVVTISSTTVGATIQYSTDGGSTWNTGNTVTINDAMTIQAKASADGYLESSVSSAEYTLHGVAVFSDGVYYESMETTASFNNMTIVNVSGNQTWEFNSSSEAAYINGYNSGYVSNEDWLITPKMAVENGKLNISFGVKRSYQSNQLSLMWSTGSALNGEWHDLTFDEGTSLGYWYYPELDIETDDKNIYVAFVYDNTSATDAAAYYVYGLEARQYYNVTFAANGGSGTMEPLSIAAGVATPLSANTFTAPAGKMFNGWDDGNGHTYANEAEITLAGNVTLTAQWADAYTVTFTTNGIFETTIQVPQGQAIGTLPKATAAYIPAGYTFKGWLANDYPVSNTAPSSYITSDYKPTDDITLKAVFAIAGEKSYTLVGKNDVTEGVYIIGALKSTTATNDFYFATATTKDGCINVNTSSTTIAETSGVRSIASLPSNAVEFTFTGNNTNGFTISTGSKYLGYTSYANNKLAFDTSYYTFTWKAVEKANALVTNGVYLDNNTSNGHYYISENTTNTNCIRAYTTTSNIYRAIYLFKKAEAPSTNYCTSYTETCDDLVIDGYGTAAKDGYRLIASPVFINPADVDDMVDGTFDLYYFDEAVNEKEWRNYEANVFDLVPGKGYLYANSDDVTLTFEGAPYGGDGVITLDYTTGKQFTGWNLVGNPFNCNAYLTDTTGKDMAFYRMNSAGNGFDAVAAGAINKMEGIFVKASEENQSITFTKTAPNLNPGKGNLNISLAQTVTNRGEKSDTDNAIIRFDGGNTLEKFSFSDNTAKIYIPQNGKDYAVVSAEARGEMPVNFKAAKNGTYTISVETENLEVSYLHLIDNMTGENVDLLQTPSYTFTGKTSDYASRFRLVFNANNLNENDSDEPFAFISNDNIVVMNEGEATLQVIDMLGRVIETKTLNGNATIGTQANGVYVLRLINGENVKTQKIVVK